jgi:hypothetical protein
MQHKNLIATSILAASFAVGCSSSADRETARSQSRVNPDIASSGTSMGGTQSQRQRETGTPLPEGSSQSGTTSSSSGSGQMRQGTTRPSDAQRVNPDVSAPGSSWGGTQSQRERETGAPLPEGSSQSGTTSSSSESGQMRQGTTRPSDGQRTNPDISSPGSSLGGTQSQRQPETGTPLPEGSSQSGTVVR